MAIVQDQEFPEHFYYDIDNQVWYDDLGDGTLRAGFTPIAMSFAGDVLVFTPKRIGHTFETNRWFAMIECGKWIGSARAAFDGHVVAHNEDLVRKPELLNSDAFATGWMLIVRPSDETWRARLVTREGVAPAFASWLASESYRTRAEG